MFTLPRTVVVKMVSLSQRNTCLCPLKGDGSDVIPRITRLPGTGVFFCSSQHQPQKVGSNSCFYTFWGLGSPVEASAARGKFVFLKNTFCPGQQCDPGDRIVVITATKTWVVLNV